MEVKMKKITLLLLALIMAFSFAACGDKDNSSSTPGGGSEKPDWSVAKQTATRITIYVDESNIYGAYISGSDENRVKDAIERKFYEDTDNAINLSIQYLTHDNFSTQFGGVMSTGQWDAAISYLGQAGLEETVLTQNIAMDLASTIAEHGSNLVKAVDKQALYATTTLDNKIIGIPSVNKTKNKGVLIRKDYMTKVGYTESKAEAEASNGTLKFCQTLDDFTDMLRKMKAEIPACTMPLIGNAYDMEFTLTAGACGTAGYQYKSVRRDAQGNVLEVVPGWLSDGYQDVLNYEYTWQKEGLWEADWTVKSDSQRISDFTNGKGAVYCVGSQILDLISVARQVKEANSAAEFTILQPLDAVDENGVAIEGTGAYVEASRTTDCLIVNKRSQKSDLIIKYLDWMYSSVENYELCAYGIEGEHWVDAGEGFYSYPAGMADRYLRNPPYSGVFALLHNDELSYRLYNSYTQEELGWIQTVENARTMKNETDAMLFYDMSATAGVNFTNAEANMYLNCATKAWEGTGDPANTYPVEYASYRQQAGDYITWLTDQYKQYIAKRA